MIVYYWLWLCQWLIFDWIQAEVSLRVLICLKPLIVCSWEGFVPVAALTYTSQPGWRPLNQTYSNTRVSLENGRSETQGTQLLSEPPRLPELSWCICSLPLWRGKMASNVLAG